MPRKTQTHLPVGPLLRAAGATNVVDLARRVDRHRRVVQRWHAEGIPESTADRLAANLDLHPFDIWPNWYDRRTHIRPTRKATP